MSEQSGSKLMHLQVPIHNWGQYSEGTEVLVHLTHDGFVSTVNTPEIYRALEMDEAMIEHAEWKAAHAQKEIDAGFSTLHAHSLLGLWGAFECLIEDIFKEAIMLIPASFPPVHSPRSSCRWTFFLGRTASERRRSCWN
ncbi:hypothetical protein QV65_24580 [Rhodococcus erythropolis]|nr:hypothetical protein QV65_24580 [Rhodococcus erythropolis]